MRQNTVLRIDVGCVVKSAKIVYTLQQTIAGRNFNTIKKRKSQKKTDYKRGKREKSEASKHHLHINRALQQIEQLALISLWSRTHGLYLKLKIEKNTTTTHM